MLVTRQTHPRLTLLDKPAVAPSEWNDVGYSPLYFARKSLRKVQKNPAKAQFCLQGRADKEFAINRGHCYEATEMSRSGRNAPKRSPQSIHAALERTSTKRIALFDVARFQAFGEPADPLR